MLRIGFTRAVNCTMILLVVVAVANARAATTVAPAQARAIAKEAYLYANPLADNYRILYGFFLYTHNFGYIGSRATGNDGGKFLIAGPNRKGSVAKGIAKLIRSETELVVAVEAGVIVHARVFA
jgi:hypothetical protein